MWLIKHFLILWLRNWFVEWWWLWLKKWKGDFRAGPRNRHGCRMCFFGLFCLHLMQNSQELSAFLAHLIAPPPGCVASAAIVCQKKAFSANECQTVEVFCRAPGACLYSPRPVPVPALDMWHHMLSCDTPICCESGRLPFENSNLMEFAPRNRKFSQQPCKEVCSQSQQNCCRAGGERTMSGRKRLGRAPFGKGWVYCCAACGRI